MADDNDNGNGKVKLAVTEERLNNGLDRLEAAVTRLDKVCERVDQVERDIVAIRERQGILAAVNAILTGIGSVLAMRIKL